MRIIGSILLITILGLSGCSDNGCKPVKPETEEAQITSFASGNSITATKHSSGMYYQVVNPGSGIMPNQSSTVFVTYVGKYLDGTIFDQSASVVSFSLSSGLIEGWRIGLPLIRKGGNIKLIVPSSLAYGCVGKPPVISPNTILYFDIQLIDVQ